MFMIRGASRGICRAESAVRAMHTVSEGYSEGYAQGRVYGDHVGIC